jgi:hypothetical protein
MMLFFGLTGMVIFLALGPLLLLLWLWGVGLGTLTWKTFGLVVAKGLLDNVLSDYLWARAILLIGAPTGPALALVLSVLPALGGPPPAGGDPLPPLVQGHLRGAGVAWCIRH